MEVTRPESALSHTTDSSLASAHTEKTLVDHPAAPKSLAETLVSRRLPANYQSSSLKEGNDGRRRRRRYEMQNLLDCPQRVEPSAEDWNIGPLYQTRTIHWDKAIDVDPMILRDWQVSEKSARDAPALCRSLRDRFKRQHINTEFVRDIESRLRDILDPAAAEPEYDILEDVTQADTHKRIRISTDAPTAEAQAYSRYWIHLIAQFYRLRSYSEDIGDERVATVVCPSGKLPSAWMSDLLRA